MHSPEVLAFSIRRIWPEIHKNSMRKNAPRWQAPIHRRDDGSWMISPFAYVPGHELYFPSLLDVWHMEPGGRDSLTVCKHRITDDQGNFVRWSNAWKWHVHHWKISPVFIYTIRRKLLTRCARCGGRSVKGNQVNHSLTWNGGAGTKWWQPEKHLFHSKCAAEESAERKAKA